MTSLAVVGAGIGGLASAVACAQAGFAVRVLEQASAFADVGAGIQLGPNATRILHAWGLADALSTVACAPQALHVRSGGSGSTLGLLPLGAACQARYGAPYLCVHRADLHGLLLAAALQHGASVETGVAIESIATNGRSTLALSVKDLKNDSQTALEGLDAVVGADGLWSAVRQQLLADGPPRATGHVAWRALLDVQAVQGALPAGSGFSCEEISVWLAPHMHLVCYPVRGGRWLNLVLIAEGPAAWRSSAALADWSHQADPASLLALANTLHATPAALLRAASGWRLWALHERSPVRSAKALAQGRIALVGDAAHAMLPYLAQGGAMALEDAAQLAASLSAQPHDVPHALAHYASTRWQRSARVQRRAARNGQIFHLRGPLEWARDAAMRTLGARLLDVPWLYGGGGS